LIDLVILNLSFLAGLIHGDSEALHFIVIFTSTQLSFNKNNIKNKTTKLAEDQPICRASSIQQWLLVTRRTVTPHSCK